MKGFRFVHQLLHIAFSFHELPLVQSPISPITLITHNLISDEHIILAEPSAGASTTTAKTSGLTPTQAATL